MEIQIFSRNMRLSERSEDYIQKKVARLERHLPERADAKLELRRTSRRSETDRFVAQMTISASGATLRGQETGLTLFAAMDAVTDVMDKQIRRYKGRAYRTSQARRSARTQAMREDAGALLEELDAAIEDEVEEAIEELGSLVRVKRFAMKPMSVEDAIMEMELLDHDFFLFHNTETNRYSVVYRRAGRGLRDDRAGRGVDSCQVSGADIDGQYGSRT